MGEAPALATTDAETERIGAEIASHLKRLECETGAWDIVQGELEAIGYRLVSAD